MTIQPEDLTTGVPGSNPSISITVKRGYSGPKLLDEIAEMIELIDSGTGAPVPFGISTVEPSEPGPLGDPLAPVIEVVPLASLEEGWYVIRISSSPALRERAPKLFRGESVESRFRVGSAPFVSRALLCEKEERSRLVLELSEEVLTSLEDLRAAIAVEDGRNGECTLANESAVARMSIRRIHYDCSSMRGAAPSVRVLLRGQLRSRGGAPLEVGGGRGAELALGNGRLRSASNGCWTFANEAQLR